MEQLYEEKPDGRDGLKTDPEQQQWWQEWIAVQRPLEGEEIGDAFVRAEKWKKANPPRGVAVLCCKWEKKWRRLQQCGTQWIAYRASCCNERTTPIAVPVGCNDRLCPLCAWNRSRRARAKVRQMYDRITHPVLITFTIPNLPSIRKKHIHHFRKMIRAWMKQNEARIEGGIYSIETTYNRDDHTWHLHAHALVSMTTPLPKASDPRVDFFGERVMPFVAAKWEWEFDWLNLCKDAWAKMPSCEMPARKAKSWVKRWDDYRFAFRQWVLQCRRHSTKWAKAKNASGKYELRRDLSPAEFEKYLPLERWNAKNRRLFDIRPVTNRDKAVCEVLKYLTKSAQFSDRPEAVEMFSAAVQGARMVQTFGSWYGFEIETAFDPEHLDDFGVRQCVCGLNCWERIGVVHRHDVEMDERGRFHLKRSCRNLARGTVPRPTIRALEPGPEKERGQEWERR